MVRDTASPAASATELAVLRPRAYALCHDESTTFAKSLRDNRPDGASIPAKWKRISASIGVKRENRVIRAASLRKSVRVILPSSLFCVAFRIIKSTRSISLITF